MSGSYVVSWHIDIEADSPAEAAAKALITQRDPESWATVFVVRDVDTGKSVQVDLGTDDDEPEIREDAEART